MIEVYKLIMNKYDDNTVHLDVNIDTRTKGHTKETHIRNIHDKSIHNKKKPTNTRSTMP